jgi:hypothetical protein
VVGLGKEVSRSDVEEGMRVGVDRKQVIHFFLINYLVFNRTSFAT